MELFLKIPLIHALFASSISGLNLVAPVGIIVALLLIGCFFLGAITEEQDSAKICRRAKIGGGFILAALLMFFIPESILAELPSLGILLELLFYLVLLASFAFFFVFCLGYMLWIALKGSFIAFRTYMKQGRC